MSDEPTVQTPKKEPTASEAMFFYTIVKHTKNKADIDWAAVAADQGFKNAEVAKVRFGQVKRKLGISSAPTDSPGSATRTTPKKATTGVETPKKTTKKGTPKKATASVASTPTKVVKNKGRTGTKGGGRAAVKTEYTDDGHDEDETAGDESPLKSVECEEEMPSSHFDDEYEVIMRSRQD